MDQITPFAVEDLHGISPRQDALINHALLDDLQYLKRLALSGPAFTWRRDGHVMGCAGIGILWKGVGEGWMILDKEAGKYPFTMHKLIIRGVEMVENDFGFHRISVSVRSGDIRSVKWIVRVGFRFEGHMPGYGPDGTDFVRYGRNKWRS